MLALAGMFQASSAGRAPKFYPDDPIQTMPPPVDVGQPLVQKVNRVYDFMKQSRHSDPRPLAPAEAINTLGDVPDSEWFTNRHGLRRMNRAELQLGPGPAEGPQPPFTIISGKSEGVSDGFRFEDSKGRSYFAKVDPIGFPELATAADVIASKFLYAVGYNTPQNEIVCLKLSDLRLSDSAKISLSRGRSRKMAWNDVKELAEDAHHYSDGTFRIVASLAVEGEYVGPFRYEGTRSDDPNDITPHEKRRDLRGLYVFSAWLNNTDTRAGNTLDAVVERNGNRFIRHYLIDFGSALGSHGNRPKDAPAGHEFALLPPSETIERILTLGLDPTKWELASYRVKPDVGLFESKLFQPDDWKSGFPNPAFLSRLPDDDYWAAKQVMAFTDDDIRALVETGRYSNPRSSEYVIDTLAKRRDKIGRTFFAKVLALDHFRVENDELLFDDLAVKYGFRSPRPYEVRWHRFDNISRTQDLIPGSGSTRLPDEAKQAAPGSYFSALIVALDDLSKLSVYVRKEGNHFKVIGIDR